MRIPAEALHPNEGGRFAEAPEIRPVDVAARLASDLPEGLPKHRQAPAAPADEEGARGQRAGNKPERRQQDRRKKNLPITLDTRLARSRREPESPISVTI